MDIFYLLTHRQARTTSNCLFPIIELRRPELSGLLVSIPPSPLPPFFASAFRLPSSVFPARLTAPAVRRGSSVCKKQLQQYK